MDHLQLRAAGGGHVEGDGPLHAVEVVVEAGFRAHEQRGGDPLQIQRAAQMAGKGVFDELDGPLGVVNRKGRAIALGDFQLDHGDLLLCAAETAENTLL